MKQKILSSINPEHAYMKSVSSTLPGLLNVEISYKNWDKRIGNWSDHFGKGKSQVYSLDGKEPVRSCNEIEIVKLLRNAGFNSFWISTYNPKVIPGLWQPWVLSFKNMPIWLSEFDSRFRNKLSSKKGGIPDVIAWRPDSGLHSCIMIECKGKKEGLTTNQIRWLKLAFSNGFSPDQFGIAIRITKQ